MHSPTLFNLRVYVSWKQLGNELLMKMMGHFTNAIFPTCTGRHEAKILEVNSNFHFCQFTSTELLPLVDLSTKNLYTTRFWHLIEDNIATV